jgi:hypothetical protein
MTDAAIDMTSFAACAFGLAPNKTTPTCSSLGTGANALSRFAAFSNSGLFVGGSFGGTLPTVAGGVTLGYYADPSGTISRVDPKALASGLIRLAEKRGL